MILWESWDLCCKVLFTLSLTTVEVENRYLLLEGPIFHWTMVVVGRVLVGFLDSNALKTAQRFRRLAVWTRFDDLTWFNWRFVDVLLVGCLYCLRNPPLLMAFKNPKHLGDCQHQIGCNHQISEEVNRTWEAGLVVFGISRRIPQATIPFSRCFHGFLMVCRSVLFYPFVFQESSIPQMIYWWFGFGFPLPSRELTYPSWGKGKPSSKVPW